MNKLTKLSIIVFLPIVLGLFTYLRYEQQHIKGISVVYEQAVEEAQHFISQEQVQQAVLGGQIATQVYTKNIDIFAVEQRLGQHPLIEQAQVYVGLDGMVHVQLKERTPIARSVVGKGFVYMDSNGKEMPLSPSYAKRVVLLSGVKVGTSAWNDAFLIASAIENDTFLKENITNVWYKNNKFYLKMREGNFTITLGNVQEVVQKFNNLKAFYKKAQRDQFLNKYKEINLQYSNQVVCIK